MAKRSNLIGRKFSELTVIEDAGNNRRGMSRWKARCSCGNITTVDIGHLNSGHTTSCGCRQGRFKHGFARTKRVNGVTREYKMWNGARGNAKKKNWLCTITVADIFIPAVCPLLGIPLDRNAPLRSDNIPSLDRIDSQKGYTPDNIWVISWKANKMKSDSSVEELKKLVENLECAITERKIKADRE